MFFVLTRYRTAGNPASLECFLRVTREAGFQASPQFGSNKALFRLYCGPFIDLSADTQPVWRQLPALTSACLTAPQSPPESLQHWRQAVQRASRTLLLWVLSADLWCWTKAESGTFFPGGPVIRLHASNRRAWVWSLIGELGSHMLCGRAEKRKNKWSQQKKEKSTCNTDPPAQHLRPSFSHGLI